MNDVNNKTNYIVKVGVLTALSVALMYVLEFPLIPAYPMLRMDFSEIPVLIGGLALGPLAVIIMEFIKNIVHFIVKNDGTAGVGNIANFLVGCALGLPAIWYYMKHKTKKGAIIGLCIGVVSMIVVGVLANYFLILPMFGTHEHAAKMLFIYGGAIPFNAIKAVLLSIVTILIYKPLSTVLHK